MSASERSRGLTVYRPIIYGSHARLLTDEEKLTAPAGHTHRWSVFLTSATSPPPTKPLSSTDAPPELDLDHIPGGADDLSYLVKKVTFRLHETYPTPSRVYDKPPFKVTETGWGEFTVQIRVQFVPESGEKPLALAHPIKLHHWGPPIEPYPIQNGGGPSRVGGSTTAASSAPGTPTPAARPQFAGEAEKKNVEEEGEGDVEMQDAGNKAGEGGQEASEGVKADADSVDHPAPDPVKPEPSGSDSADPSVETAPAAGAAVPATPATAAEAAEPSTPQPTQTIHIQPATPLSIAQKYPVHSWQYDELVFTDPPTVFLNLLNEHPPTPLPAKNRRARDQREEYESRKPAAKKGRLAQVRSSLSRELGAAASSSSPGATPNGADEAAAAADAPRVGIPGELGSADVPLEFSVEMEKGEWNKLNDARVKVISELDKWRERLIAQEKELAKLKQEVKGQ